MKRIEKLTPEQKAQIPAHIQKWIDIGLRTGETDWDTFNTYMKICYEKAGLVYPKNVVRVQSPLVGALAASRAEQILRGVRKGGAVGDAVDSAVLGAVGDAVGSAVRGAVDSAVGSAVFGAVDSAVDSVKLDWHYWLGGQFWVGGWWYGSPAYVSFFLDVCGLELDPDIVERATAYRKVCESVNYIWCNRDFVMVCARPKHIHRNIVGRLHSDREQAIEYPDGYGLYMLNGVRFDEELWKKVVSRKMPFDEILKIVDVDQRKQAMKYANVWDFVQYAKGKELDTHTKVGAKDGRKIRYWLYEFPADRDQFPNGAKYMIYEDSMLGAAEIHMQGVPLEVTTVPEAMGWKQWITAKQWDSLVLDRDFT